MAMASCGDATPDANDTELEVAAAAGRAMGEHAAALPENSMEQQNAVLDIRARETAIRDASCPRVKLSTYFPRNNSSLPLTPPSHTCKI